jgi:hypothetical protein
MTHARAAAGRSTRNAVVPGLRNVFMATYFLGNQQ